MINPFKKKYTDREEKTFAFLMNIPLFANLAKRELEEFLPYLNLRKYNKNEVVFFRDDPSAGLYIVKEGEVSLKVDVRERFEELTVVIENQAFGDNSLLPETRRIYNAVVASDKAALFMVPQVNLFEVFEDHPKIHAKMMQALAVQYNQYTYNLFKAYKSSFGFFNLGQAYSPQNGAGPWPTFD